MAVDLDVLREATRQRSVLLGEIYTDGVLAAADEIEALRDEVETLMIQRDCHEDDATELRRILGRNGTTIQELRSQLEKFTPDLDNDDEWVISCAEGSFSTFEEPTQQDLDLLDEGRDCGPHRVIRSHRHYIVTEDFES